MAMFQKKKWMILVAMLVRVACGSLFNVKNGR
jgi:hypothetical protein